MSDLYEPGVYKDENGNRLVISSTGTIKYEAGATVDQGARIDFSDIDVVAANTDGGIIKAGTSSDRIVSDVANMKFISEYFDNGATSGDNRGMYLRLYLTGAGGGGEALRVFTTCEDVACGTAHGAHISLNFGATGSVTGQGIASRNTLHVPDANLGGTVAATQAEIWSDGSSSAITGKASFLRFVNGGDATGIDDVLDNADLMELSGFAIASGNIIAAKSSAAVSHTARVNIDGAPYWVLLSNVQ